MTAESVKVTVKLLRIDDQVVYRDNGAQGSSTLVGYGFVNDENGNPHGLELEACILDSGGDACEDPSKIIIEQPKNEYKNDSRYILKITVMPPPSGGEYDRNFYGLRNVVIKKKDEHLEADGSCPTDSTTCSILTNVIRIKRADD